MRKIIIDKQTFMDAVSELATYKKTDHGSLKNGTNRFEWTTPVAERFKVHPSTLYRLIKEYELGDFLEEVKRVEYEKYLKSDKTCSCCGETKTWENFIKYRDKAKRTTRKVVLSTFCTDCKKEKSKQVRESEGYKSNRIAKEYGIDPEEYIRMVEEQGNKCAICKNEETRVHPRTKNVISLAVDHCHITGKVRALLCQRCNIALGHLDDDIERLKVAIDYLTKYNFVS
jgi:hypothetical protein